MSFAGSSGGSAPAAPTGLTATAGNTQVVLGWTASSGATSYNVYRGTTSGGESATAIATGIATTAYTNTGLTNGTTYYYKVTAVNTSGTSGYSNEASAIPSAVNYAANPGFETGALSPWFVWSPNGTESAAGVQTGVSHAGTYSAYETSTSAFKVDISENSVSVPNGTYTMTAWVWSPTLPSNTCYMYAYNQDTTGGGLVNIAQSSGYVLYTLTNVNITTGLAQFGFYSDALANQGIRMDDVTFVLAGGGGSAPPAPTGLTATAGNNQVTLSWTASSGATSYNVYRGTSAGGESTTAIATGIATTSYTNTGLANGTTYYYKVTAVNASGTSGYSNEASATPVSPNYAANPGFETGNLTSWVNWSPNGTNSAGGVETANPHSGTYNAFEASTSSFQVDLSENSVTVPNGTYTLTAWVKAPVLPSNSCYLYGQNQDGTNQLRLNIAQSAGYVQYTLTNIQVTTGSAQFGFWSDALANQGIRIDDVTFTKN